MKVNPYMYSTEKQRVSAPPVTPPPIARVNASPQVRSDIQKSVEITERELAGLATQLRESGAKKTRLWKCLEKARARYGASLKEFKNIESEMEVKRYMLGLITQQVTLPPGAPAQTHGGGALAPGFDPGTQTQASPIRPRQLSLAGDHIPPLPSAVPNLPVATIAALEPPKKKQLTLEESFSTSDSWEQEALKATAAVEDAALLISAKKSMPYAKSPPESLTASGSPQVQKQGGLKTEGLTAEDYDEAMVNEAIALSEAEANHVHLQGIDAMDEAVAEYNAAAASLAPEHAGPGKWV